MKRLLGIAFGLGILLTLLSQNLHAQVQLISTKSDFGGGYNISCYGGSNGSISVAVVGADSLSLVLYKGASQEDSTFVNSLPKVWNGLGAGGYKIYGYINDSLVAEDSLVLFQPQSLALTNHQAINQSCNPGGDGSIEAEISGGVLPYHFSWTGRSDTVAFIDSLNAGSYGFTVTDGNGCQFSSSVNVGTANAPQMALHVSELNQWGYHILCGEDETAKVWAEVEGNQSYAVNWNVRVIQGGFNDDFFGQQDSSSNSYSYFVSNMDSLVGVSSGWYKATATNSSGCSTTDSIEVKGPFRPGLQLGVICNPNFTTQCQCYAAQVVLKPMGGVPPYTINGIEVEVQDTFPIFIDSLQLFFFQDQAGCSPNFGGSDTLEINPTLEELVQVCGSVYNTPLSISSISKSSYPGGYNVSKNGGQDGTAQVVAQGGCLDGRRYFIRKVGDPSIAELEGNSADQLNAGNYMAYVYSCDSTQVDSLGFTLTQPESLQAAIGVSYQTNCNGNVSATLFAQVSGGVGIYSYQWKQSIENGSPVNIGPAYNMVNVGKFATYYLKATDANGDSSLAELAITPAAQLSIQANAVAKYGEYHTRCDVGDGEIEVQLSGGIAPYTLHLNGTVDLPNTSGFSRDTTVAATSITLQGFFPGSVNLWVEDAGGCSTSLGHNVNLQMPNNPEVFVTGEKKSNGYYVSCDTCTDAHMSVNLGAVNVPMTYGWYAFPEYSTMGFSLDGATLIQGEETEEFTGEGLTPFSTSSSINHAVPGVFHKLLAIDALGCYSITNFVLEKPKPFTQGWALDGNCPIDSTDFIGTCDSSDLVFKTNLIERLRIKANGKIGINTSYIPDGFKLAVNGKILTEEVEVRFRGDWPDYVFGKEYKKMKLMEVENYLLDHHHLPGIPSSAEVKANGYNLGDMDAKLLQKIEELTLYIIELQKKVDLLEGRIEQK
jgi:hypothetical protein